MNVVVLGASDNPDRYSHRAVVLLKDKGYHVLPVHPRLNTIADLPVFHSLRDIKCPVDTLTIYIGKSHSDPVVPTIITLKPRRLIFNPGSENDALAEAAKAAGIEVVYACTIVMLSTGRF